MPVHPSHDFSPDTEYNEANWQRLHRALVLKQYPDNPYEMMIVQHSLRMYNKILSMQHTNESFRCYLVAGQGIYRSLKLAGRLYFLTPDVVRIVRRGVPNLEFTFWEMMNIAINGDVSE